MIWMKTYENWILSDGLDLTSKSDIKLYIEYNALDTLVLDIWKWCEQNYNIYPSKITKDMIQYDGPYRSKIKIDISGDFRITIYRPNPKGVKILNSSNFSWKNLRNSFEFEF